MRAMRATQPAATASSRACCTLPSSLTRLCRVHQPGVVSCSGHRPSRACSVTVQAFKNAPPPPPSATPSRTSLLAQLTSQASVGRGNVYSKPLSKSELAALQAAIEKFGGGTGATSGEHLRMELLSFLKDAAATKSQPLPIVEGAMVLLELLFLNETRGSGEPLTGIMTKKDMLCRWQLVIGADVGSIQYIPVVEELEVAPGGATFALDTDLGVLFTGFSGDSSWLSEGHLQYHVCRVRLELRPSKGWARWWTWMKWRAEQASKGVKHYNDKEAEPDYGAADPAANTCRPDLTKPALTLAIPFPANELFIFASNGDVAALRSKLGGLILLVNKSPAAMRGT